jgi:hypothetical protein
VVLELYLSRIKGVHGDLDERHCSGRFLNVRYGGSEGGLVLTQLVRLIP